jgi:arylsulfatase
MSSNEDQAYVQARKSDGTLNRRCILLGGTTLAGAASTFGASGAPMQIAKAQQPLPTQSLPNILFILVDNLGYGELGVYGGGVTRSAPTPRIDRLASEGLRLTNMNMEAQCTPSRSSILTGRYAIRSAPTRCLLAASRISRNGK